MVRLKERATKKVGEKIAAFQFLMVRLKVHGRGRAEARRSGISIPYGSIKSHTVRVRS